MTVSTVRGNLKIFVSLFFADMSSDSVEVVTIADLLDRIKV